eukprot:COSAG05_NODE_743_length_7589_cov_336.682510_3_plen_718_part_00
MPAAAVRRDHKQVAQDTLTALRRGRYSTEEGVRRVLAPADRVRDAPGKTLVHANTQTLAPVAAKGKAKDKDDYDLKLFVGGSFDAAQWLLSTPTLNGRQQTPAVLDFASDSNPGGGFRGSQQGTQEEDLCRQSNLGVCLEDLYDRVGGASYMPRRGAVYVPDVIVFRGGEGCVFLDEPFWVSVIASSLRNGDADDPQLLQEKVVGVLSVAAHHGHRTVVLGAWGCGAFGNAAERVASAFRDCLRSAQFRYRFDRVVFALPKKKSENFNAFRAAMPEADVVDHMVVKPSATDEQWRHAPWSYSTELELEQEPEPEPETEAEHYGAAGQSLAELVGRCKSLYTQLSRQQSVGSVSSANSAALAQLDEAADAALLVSGGQQPFATMSKGWLALQHGQTEVAEATLERGLAQLRRSGKSGKIASEMERLLAQSRNMKMPDGGSELVRTLSARERARAAAAAVAEQDAQLEERALQAELAILNQQVGKLVLGAGAEGGGGGGDTHAQWAEPVPTPALLTSQIWDNAKPSKRSKGEARTRVIVFYGHKPGTPYACFSNFSEAPVAEPFEFVLPDGLVPQGVDAEMFPSPIVVEFSEKAIMLCKAAAMGDSRCYRSIMSATDPRSAKAKGRQVYPFDDALWQSLVCHVAREVVYQKFSKVPRLGYMLMNTGDSIIAEASSSDRLWGIGLQTKDKDVGNPSKWQGTNVLGWALMQTRTRLRGERF